MVDAETASDFKTGTTLSIIAKAEAFYNMGTKARLKVRPYRAKGLDLAVEN